MELPDFSALGGYSLIERAVLRDSFGKDLKNCSMVGYNGSILSSWNNRAIMYLVYWKAQEPHLKDLYSIKSLTLEFCCV
jgi:hypothetical protein